MLFKLADAEALRLALSLERRGPSLFDLGIDHSDRSRRVAIVGAGISGLVSAWLLKQAGHDVSIFEAAQSVGGRLKTIRAPFSSGLYAEAGAMRIPGHHRLTLGLAQAFGLDLIPFRNDCDDGLVHLNGRRHTRGCLPDDPRLLGFPVDGHERGHTARDLFEAAVIRFVRETCNIGTIEAACVFDARAPLSAEARRMSAHLDRLSLGTFLRQAAGLSPAAVDYVLALLSLEAHQTSSMAAIVGDHREMTTSETFWQIRGGMDALANAFVSGPIGGPSTIALPMTTTPVLAGDIHHGARLVELLDSPAGVRLRVEHPVTRRCRDTDSFDHVILSAPLSALRHVRFNGLASREKCRAIRCLHYDNSCKILLEFDDCFWLSQTGAPILGGHSVTDRPVRSIHYPTVSEDDRPDRAILLASYTWADDSLRWTSLRPDDRIRFALRDIEEVHGLAPGVLDASCRVGTSHSWIEQAFASGAVAMFGPHQLTTLFPDIWRPEGRLHYCGEHTSGRHGWIEGAIESAFRVSVEVCEQIEKDAGQERVEASVGAQ